MRGTSVAACIHTLVRRAQRSATRHVGRLYAERAQRVGTLGRLASLLAAPTSDSSSARGQFWEVRAHEAVCGGGRMQYRLLDVPCAAPATGGKRRCNAVSEDAMQAALAAATAEAAAAQGSGEGEPLFLELPELQEQAFAADDLDSFQDAARQATSVSYLRPDKLAHPVFDACIYPDRLLQYTVLHWKAGVDEALLERYLRCLPPAPRYYLDYVVPAHVYPHFKAAPLTRGRRPLVGRTYVRVCKVEASAQAATHARPQPRVPLSFGRGVGPITHLRRI